MTIRYLLAAAALTLGCASGAPATAATPQSGADCGVRYAVTVVNEGNTSVAEVYFSDARLMKPAARLGDVAPKDERTFFFISDDLPTAWVSIDGVRIFPNDRAAQQRLRVRIVLGCDAG